MSEAMSSPEDIARARHVKGLEPLHDAWTSWLKTREVRLIPPQWPKTCTRRLYRPQSVFARYAPAAPGSGPDDALPGRGRVHGAPGAPVDTARDNIPSTACPALADVRVLGATRAQGGRRWLGGDALPRGPAAGVHAACKRARVARGRDPKHGGARRGDARGDCGGQGGRGVRRTTVGDGRASRAAGAGDGGKWAGAYEHRRDHCRFDIGCEAWPSAERALVGQVLPLSEEAEPAADDNLFKIEDVKIEVMRSRGAGGQVRSRPYVFLLSKLILKCVFLSTSTKPSRPCG